MKPAMTPAMTPSPAALRCDVFCRVVDNYGDAAVCWRLALALAAEQGFGVRLWIDRPEVLAALQPALDPAVDVQWLEGVEVRRSPPTDAPGLPDIAIDAFGGGLPDAYAEALAMRRPRALCIVLEYLSAESWVAGVHGLASPHPVLDLRRFYFCPGFEPGTGGLLRDRGLLAARDAWQSDPHAGEGFLERLGLPAPADDSIRVSLFGYANPGLHTLLDAMAAGPGRVQLALAPGPLAEGALAWLRGAGVLPPGAALEPGRSAVAGALQATMLPFLPQPDFDRLLWSCDLNFVRGEDSLVRALWAARPLCWQLYPQQDDAQCPKLDAFSLACRRQAGPARGWGEPGCAAVEALERLQSAWNGCATGASPGLLVDAGTAAGQSAGQTTGHDPAPFVAALAAAWPGVRAGLPVLRRRSALLAGALAGQPDLAARLAGFCREQLK